MLLLKQSFMTDSSPVNHENYRYYPPLDGGGLRWDWTWYVSPSPPPSPARGEGDNRVIFGALRRKEVNKASK
jgi:hypothetical protein